MLASIGISLVTLLIVFVKTCQKYSLNFICSHDSHQISKKKIKEFALKYLWVGYSKSTAIKDFAYKGMEKLAS